MLPTKIYFSDFWSGFDVYDNFILNRLRDYDILVDSQPDILFYSSYGKHHLKYNNCVKVYFTGENDVPDFNYCDYAISFHPIVFEDRHLRFPLYLLYDQCYESIRNKTAIPSELSNRKFCNFVYSNSKLADPFRAYFFYQLSKYKKVDSGGKLLNNIGGAVNDKQSFIKDYKFTIAFENSSISGYTTEKIVEPMSVNSIPIYWGNPNVDIDFNEKSFVWVKDKSSVNEIIDYIVYLDERDDEYLNKLSEPWLTDEQRKKNWGLLFSSFLGNIIDQKLSGKRTTDYGYVKLIREKRQPLLNRFFISLNSIKK